MTETTKIEKPAAIFSECNALLGRLEAVMDGYKRDDDVRVGVLVTDLYEILDFLRPPMFPVEVMVGLVPTKYPPPHARYLVVRDGVTCTATPCYGMHQPWWVVRTFGEDARPVAMQPGDEWRELKPNASLTGGSAAKDET